MGDGYLTPVRPCVLLFAPRGPARVPPAATQGEETRGGIKMDPHSLCGLPKCIGGAGRYLVMELPAVLLRGRGGAQSSP